MHAFVPTTPVYISDTITTSSLGLDSATVAANLRCGIARPAEIQGFAVTAEDGEDVEVTGHPISLVTFGFEGLGRRVRMFEAAFRRIASRLSTDEYESNSIYMLVGVPSNDRYKDGVDFENGLPLEDVDDESLIGNVKWSAVVDSCMRSTGIDNKISGALVEIVPSNDVTSLLRRACAALEADPNRVVILVSMDTLTDFAGLHWLYRTGRLKTANFPTGLMPGECVNAIFLNTSCKNEKAVRLESIDYEREPNHIFSGKEADGRGLARLLAEFARSNIDEESWLITNLTGERHYAYEWGVAQYHFCDIAGTELNDVTWLPNVSVGEIGIAFLNMAITWAHQAKERGYTVSQRCGIPLLDYTDARSLVSLRV